MFKSSRIAKVGTFFASFALLCATTVFAGNDPVKGEPTTEPNAQQQTTAEDSNHESSAETTEVLDEAQARENFEKALDMKTDRPDEAAALLHDAVGAFGDDVQMEAKVRTNLARCYMSADQSEKALQPTAEAIELDPESSQVWNVRGLALMEAGDNEEATLAFAKATRLDSGNYWAYNNSGYLSLMEGDLTTALTSLEAARTAAEEIGETLPSVAWNNLGVVYEKKEMVLEAVDAYSAAAEQGHAGAQANLERLEESLPEGEEPVQDDALMSRR